MKIIKHGCVIHFICQVCGCEFLMSEDEPECYKSADQEEKKGEDEYLAVCPDCGEGDVPGHKEQKGDLPVTEEEPPAEEKEPEEDPEPKGRSTDFTKTEFPSSI